MSRSAKLIVSMPAASDLGAKSGDGSIDVERVSGRVEMRSGDGSIRAHDIGGDVTAHSGDGSNPDRRRERRAQRRHRRRQHRARGQAERACARAPETEASPSARNPGSTSSADWDISTGDGSVTLELPDGFGAQLDAHTGDGGIHMRDVTVSNVSGEIRRNTVRGQLGSGGRMVRVRTGDGSITLKKF